MTLMQSFKLILSEIKLWTENKLKGKLGTDEAASSANKLKTPRKIKLSGGINAEANFDGSNDANITVNEISESYVKFGGKDITGDVSALDAAMLPELSANRIAFLDPSLIIIERSTDGGQTWEETTHSDNQKLELVSLSNSIGIKAGSTDVVTTDHKIRITIIAENLYFRLQKILLHVSSNGALGCKCTVEGAEHKSPDNFVYIKESIVSGWSGWNVIQMSTAFGGSSYGYKKIRLVFSIDSISEAYDNNFSILALRMLGSPAWATSNSAAKNGDVYQVDARQNVTFPAKVSATTLSEGGLLLSTKYATKDEISALSSQISALNEALESLKVKVTE